MKSIKVPVNDSAFYYTLVLIKTLLLKFILLITDYFLGFFDIVEILYYAYFGRPIVELVLYLGISCTELYKLYFYYIKLLGAGCFSA